MPPPGEVHVWSVALGVADVAPLGAILSEDELLRAGAIVSAEGRDRAIVSRAALRTLLGRYLGQAPDELRFTAGRHGKPRVDGPLGFNLSHSGRLGLIAVARGVEVGVDVEQVAPRRDLPGLARRMFAEGEREAIDVAADPQVAFYRHWVAKEAFVKAVGRGVLSMRSIEVLLEAPGGARIMHVGGDPAEAARWTLAPLELEAPGYVGAVVAEGPVTVAPVRELQPL